MARLTPKERRLVRLLAEAYAFISDLRSLAIDRVDSPYIKKTRGINEEIEVRRKEYPRTFQRYYLAAIKRAKEATSGKGESIAGREKTAEEKRN
jgi:hypothetical protein